MNKKIFYGFMLILVVYIYVAGSTYFKSQLPIIQAENAVMAKAEAELDLQKYEKLYLFTKGETTYYSIVAINQENRPVYFSYDPESEYTKFGYGDEMVNEIDALALARYNLPNVEVKEARLGIEDDQFVWEVSFYAEDGSLGYHYIDATTGQWYETINNL